MKDGLLAFLIINSISGLAQTHPPVEAALHGNVVATRGYFQAVYPWAQTFAGDNKLKSVDFYDTMKKREVSHFEFDGSTRLIAMKLSKDEITWTSGTGKRIYEIHYTYNPDGNIREALHYDKKGKEIWATRVHYTTKNIQSVKNYANTKLYSETNYELLFDSLLKSSEYVRVKGGLRKSIGKYEYTYDEDRKLKQVRLFRKNKLKYTWSYACAEKGRLLKKDTATVCVVAGTDNKGRTMHVKHYTDAHGRNYKEVEYLRMLNGRQTHSETEKYRIARGKEVLVMNYHLPDSAEPYYTYQFYNRRGIETLSFRTEYVIYSMNLKITSKVDNIVRNRHGKQVSRTLQTYTPAGLPIATQLCGRSGREKKRIEFLYKNNDEVFINHYAKNKLSRAYVAKLLYY